jgi:hypothetical protein
LQNYNGRTAPSNASPTIQAELTGATTCSAAGIAAHGNAPMLALCRQLLAAGLDPDSALAVYRSTTLAIRVRSIGEAAKLTVRESTPDGRPRFARLNSDVGPPMRKSGSAATDGRHNWPVATDSAS